MPVSVTIDTKSALSTAKALRGLPKDIRKDVAKAVSKGAVTVARKTRQKLRSSRSPSPPGAPPGKQTGRLSRSIRKRTVRNSGGLAARVIADLRGLEGRKSSEARPLFLEEGHDLVRGKRRTRTHPRTLKRVTVGGVVGRVAPRPFLTAALAEEEPDHTRRVGKAVAEALDKAASRVIDRASRL